MNIDFQKPAPKLYGHVEVALLKNHRKEDGQAEVAAEHGQRGQESLVIWRNEQENTVI